MKYMETQKFLPKIENRPERYSLRQHKAQKFWQILLPVLLSVAGFIAVMVLTISLATTGDSNGRLSVWADGSLILLLIPSLLVALMVVVVVGGFVYAMTKILKVIPTYTEAGQRYAMLVDTRVRSVTRKIATPLITIRSYQAGAKRFFETLFGRS